MTSLTAVKNTETISSIEHVNPSRQVGLKKYEDTIRDYGLSMYKCELKNLHTEYSSLMSSLIAEIYRVPYEQVKYDMEQTKLINSNKV